MLPLIELGGAAFDICMADTEVFDMPMELGLELMAIIGFDFSYPELELVDNVIDKVLSVRLGMLLADLERGDAGGVINGGVLEAPDLLSLLSDESLELYNHLDVMEGDLFVIAFGSNFAQACSAQQPVQAIAFEYPIDGSVI